MAVTGSCRNAYGDARDANNGEGMHSFACLKCEVGRNLTR